jgi:23S rRNA-intervening sequence protein
MGNGVDRFEDLDVWKLADELRREVLEFTNKGLATKDFKYRDQIRDATSSVARNTAEGFGRFNPGEFARFLGFAHASLTRPRMNSSTDASAATSIRRYSIDSGSSRNGRSPPIPA